MRRAHPAGAVGPGGEIRRLLIRVLAFNWRDILHPEAGGAEIHLHEIMKGLVSRGHKVTLLCSSFPNAAAAEEVDGIEIVRAGDWWNANFVLPLKYAAVLRRGGYDLVVEDIAPIKRGEKGDRETVGKRIAFYTEKGKHGTHDNLRCEASYYYALKDYDTIGELLTSGIKRGLIRTHGNKIVVVRAGTNDVIDAFTSTTQKMLRQVIEVDFDLELALRREILASAGKQCLYQ